MSGVRKKFTKKDDIDYTDPAARLGLYARQIVEGPKSWWTVAIVASEVALDLYTFRGGKPESLDALWRRPTPPPPSPTLSIRVVDDDPWRAPRRPQQQYLRLAK